MNYDYDLLAIGGDSGGTAIVARAASYGHKCLVIEKERLGGGTCVNIDCVSKKMMWYAAEAAFHLDTAPSLGFEIGHPNFNWSEYIEKRGYSIQKHQ